MAESREVQRAPAAEREHGRKRRSMALKLLVFGTAEFLQSKKGRGSKFGFWSEELMKQVEVKKK